MNRRGASLPHSEMHSTRTNPRSPLSISRPLALLVAVFAPASCFQRGTSTPSPSRQTSDPGAWTAYGGDALGSRFSRLAEINRENVSKLEVAWTYRTGENRPEFATRRRTSLEATPLLIDGTLYLSTPLGRVAALDPVSGVEKWVFNPQPPVDRQLGFGDFTNRGVSYWRDARAMASGQRCAARIFVGTIDGRIIAMDAADGVPCRDFGVNGTVDLRARLRNAPFETEEFQLTSPPAVVNGLIITGSSIADNNRTDAASGEVRAYDARTGALRWTWDPVPQDPADPAYATWIGPKAHSTGAANAWSVIAADAERDLVFVPTGSASPDYYGGERIGDNRYANSVVALRASTGKVVWHFQVVHHDLWDYDVASPPALVTIRKDGRTIPVVLQATKTGQLFVLHRETGQPVFPIEERPVPASDVPGERASPTQPFNTVIPPLSPQRLTPDEAWGVTAEDRAWCRAQLATLRNEGIYTPPSERGSVVVPSNIGGAHWGGLAVDPERQIAVIPVNRLVASVQLIPRARFNRDSVRASRTRAEYTNMSGTPYVMRREILVSPSVVPCSAPPFGALVAIDLATGRKLWEVPLGTMQDFHPGQVPAALTASAGSFNLGGPIATAGGVVFIAATTDFYLRAFDIETGRELWKGRLPAGGKATPMTFRLPNGRQHVVVAAGGDGGENFGKSDSFVAFALPR